MTPTEQQIPGESHTASRILWMAVAAGALFLFARAFLKAPCWSLFLPVTVIAWPIWHDQKEYALFRRRTVLAGVMLEDSWIRRWFWSGHVSGAWQAVKALVWATVLLAFGALLSPERWAVLAVDALILALIIGPVSRRLAGQVRGEQVGLVARRWPLVWLSFAVLTVGFVMLDFFLIGAPDTRGMAWNVVAEKAFSDVNATASCRLAGWLVGGLATADRLIWHSIEVLIPSLPDKELKLAAWAIVLLQVGFLSVAFTRFQLGVVAVVEHRTRRLAAPGGEGPGNSSRTFVVAILVLAAASSYVAFKLRDFDPAALATGARKVIAWANPCRPDTQALAALKTSFAAEVDRVRTAAKQRASEQIDGALDPLFADVEQGIDRYLDWYFSVPGEYERLVAWAAGTLAEQMKNELEQRLFGGFGFADRLERANNKIVDGSVAQMSALATQLGVQIKSEVQTSPCRLETMNLSAFGDLDRDLHRAVAAGGTGMAVAAATGALAKMTAAAVARKVASKEVIQGGARLTARTAAKRGGSMLLPALGAATVCGPLAPLCAVGAGIGTWLLADQAFIKIDELRFRAGMRAEILESLLRQKVELAKEMRAMHYAAVDEMALGIRNSVEGAFIPVRDGL